ncbi:ATP-binding cassette domain-containing protein [Thioclava sp. 'Guangxiensis']|uniref:thiamine ABC transporter ATP-binding protein n=1 Tax=Thioclava sp. 'Guangxiensis' TaxID=3149044 RepID=UPI00387841DB
MLALDNITLHQDDWSLCADLTIGAGQHTALIGPSGAGKSTLLAAIAGLFPLESGRILWQGQDLVAQPTGKRPLSILFQDQNLFPHLTIAQNLGLGISPRLNLSAADRARIETVLEATGLAGLGPRRPAELSGGQQSRAALARALLRNRPLLLLDEAFSALGPALKSEMLALTRTLAAEHRFTLLMVTHDPEDAKAICPQTILVADGRAEAPQDTGALLADPPAALRAYLGG